MVYFFSKAIGPLLRPLTILVSLLLLTWFYRRYPRRVSRLLCAAIAVLLFFSCPIFTNYPRAAWENTYPSRPVAEYPMRDAIVVLGGSMAQTKFPRYQPEETSGARVLMAWRLFHAGKAAVILCSGGAPYIGIYGKERTEADDIAELLGEWGVPSEKVIRESESRTTLENALNTAKILLPQKKNKILLVTTAMHLKRAAGLYRRAGFDVVAVPSTWYQGEGIHFDDLFPDVGVLYGNSLWLKEVAGLVFFRLLGKA